MPMNWMVLAIYIVGGIFVAVAVGIAIKAVFFTDYRE
jgi:hypothetical protein